MPLFSRLLPAVTSAYAFQAVAAAIFVPLHQETFYDCSGALGWLSTAFVSLYYPSLKATYIDRIPGATALPSLASFAPRQVLLSVALGLWAVRLGSFLTLRAIKAGGDSRFDEIKHKPLTFTFYWFAQATWILLGGLPVYLVNALPARVHPALGVRDYAAVGLFATSLVLETLADVQKTRWRARKDRKEHDELFISEGLWRVSRHPNYVAEVGVWTGIWALSTGSLQASAYPLGTIALAALSPLFVHYILRYGSGVPPLEKAGDRRWGGNALYQEYKRTVPVFWPWGSTKA